MMNNKRIKCAGFTLVEVIIAITMIGLAIAAASSLTQRSLQLGREGLENLAARYRAEEGIETVRRIRDENWRQNRAWREGLSDGRFSETVTIETVSEDAMRAISRAGRVAITAEFTNWQQ